MPLLAVEKTSFIIIVFQRERGAGKGTGRGRERILSRLHAQRGA